MRAHGLLFALLLAPLACGPSDGDGGGPGGGGDGDGGGGKADGAADGGADSLPGTDGGEVGPDAGPPPLDGEAGNFSGTLEGRDFLIHVPPGYDKDTPLPLLVGLHGACTPIDEFWDKDGVQNLITAADPADFIVVLPESKGGCNSEDGFCNDFVYWPPTCDIGDNDPIDGEADDLVAFVDELSRHWAVDPAQVHLWGHSNGGIFVGIGGIARADRFATLSVFAMGWGAGNISTAAPSRDIPIQFICGTDDASRCDAAQDSEAYYDAQGHPTRMVVIPNGEHSIDDNIPSVSAATADFAWMAEHPLP